MKKFLVLLLAICLLLVPSTAFAGVRIIENPDDPRKNLYVHDIYENIVMSFVYGSKIKDNEDYPMPPIYQEGKRLKGKYTYSNYDSSKLGMFDLQWVFTPEDKSIKPITGTVKAIIILPTWGTMRDEDDEKTAPVFKHKSLTMEVGTSYYPQIDNNIGGSDYVWKTSDKSIVSINKKTGKVTAKKAGTATITCYITSPYDEEFTLQLKVKVVDNKKINANIQLADGEVFKIQNKYDTSNHTVIYTSNKPSIADVGYYTGEITARREGTTYITRIAMDMEYNTYIERFDITVTEPTE